MKKSTRTLLLSGLLAAVHLGPNQFGLNQLATAQSAVSDPRIGTWKLKSAQCSMDPPNRLSISHEHDQLHVVMTGETHVDFTANRNGHESAAPGNLGFNQIELHRIDKRQAEVVQLKDGKLVATIREQLSKDGKELTATTVVAGQPDRITVWTRTGGAKSANDLFAGEWTEDLSKTRLRQGLVLKIEADGNGGVRFLGDYSYEARFDGKPYDLRNSRNDTVTLQLIDPHTVGAIYQRDQQVTQKDRWQVSTDGRQMTLSTAGTLETGQKLTEKLAFEK